MCQHQQQQQKPFSIRWLGEIGCMDHSHSAQLKTGFSEILISMWSFLTTSLIYLCIKWLISYSSKIDISLFLRNIKTSSEGSYVVHISFWFILVDMEQPQLSTANFTWSIFKGSPSRRRASAGMMSPSLMLIMSPGTNTEASSSLHFPSRSTCTCKLD